MLHAPRHHIHSSCPAHPQVLGEVHERGMVIQVLDKAFDVVIAQYGTIQRVHMEVRLTHMAQGGMHVYVSSDT